MSRGAREVGTTVSSGGKDSLVRAETVKGTILHVQGENTAALAILHDEVQGEVLDEEVGVVAEGLAIKGVKNRVAGTISDSGATVGLTTLAKLQTLTTKGTLVDLALLGSGEGDTVVLQLDNTVRGLATHVMDSILITEPVRTLDSIVHVPSPVILAHVSESSIDTTLGSDSVGTGREELGDTSSVETSLSKTEGGTETGTTGTDDESIVGVVNNGVLGGDGVRGLLSVQRLGGKDLHRWAGGVKGTAGDMLGSSAAQDVGAGLDSEHSGCCSVDE